MVVLGKMYTKEFIPEEDVRHAVFIYTYNEAAHCYCLKKKKSTHCRKHILKGIFHSFSL